MLTHYACTHCGSWILWFDTREPPFCANCMDVRNALPEEDFAYLHIDAARAPGAYETHWRETVPGLWEYWTTPQLGLGSHGWLLIRGEGGNVAFEAAPFYTEAARAHIESLGGIGVLAASHPHGYGALWQLQEMFGPELIIHRDDLQHTKAFKVNRPIDDFYRLDDRLEMRRLGGHYEGQTALYDAELKILFLGDALKIDFAQRGDGGDAADFVPETPVALSCHKGYHYAIPLTDAELRHYREVFTGYDFEHVCTPFEFGRGVGQREAVALVDYLLATGIHTEAVALEVLAAGARRKGPAGADGRRGAPTTAPG